MYKFCPGMTEVEILRQPTYERRKALLERIEHAKTMAEFYSTGRTSKNWRAEARRMLGILEKDKGYG